MNENITKSPVPNKVEEVRAKDATMSFPAAIEAVSKGKRIHKLEWKDKAYYGFLNNDILSLHKPDGKNYQWMISEGDLLGDDFIVF